MQIKSIINKEVARKVPMANSLLDSVALERKAIKEGVKIQTTEDYSQFKTIESNRKLQAGHVNKIMASISMHNLLPWNPILVTPKMEVIDGQHRLEAARRLHLPISYVVVPNTSLNDMQLLNYNNEPWKMRDFLNFYAAQGNKNYIKLREFIDEYGFPVSTGLILMSGGRRDRNNLTTFKRGEFVIEDEDNAYEMADRLMDLRPHIDDRGIFKTTWRSRDWIVALNVAYQKVDHDLLMKKFRSSGIVIQPQRSTKEYLRKLEDVVNFAQSVNQTRLY